MHNCRYGEEVIRGLSPTDALRLGLRRAIIESLALDTADVTAERKEDILRATKDKAFSTQGIGVKISPETGKAELVYRSQGAKLGLEKHLGVDCKGSLTQKKKGLLEDEKSGWKNLPLLANSDRKFEVLIQPSFFHTFPLLKLTDFTMIDN